MVSVGKQNAYELREYLNLKVTHDARFDPFKMSFLYFLGLAKADTTTFDVSGLSLYQKCAIAGLDVLDERVSPKDILRLLGQDSRIDSTPLPWVSDMFGVFAVKRLITQAEDRHMNKEFEGWTSRFLRQQIDGNHLNIFEKDIAGFVCNGEHATYASASIQLFLHYQRLRLIDNQLRQSLISRFMTEFKEQANGESSTALLSLMVYVFDRVNEEVSIVPPRTWTLSDLLDFLEHIPDGLKRWTWEDSERTKGAMPVKWFVENEYHVQNLLYILLAPLFHDITDELYAQPVGQKTPRMDMYLPSLHTIIEVKYKKDNRKSFQALIGEIAEDASLYRTDNSYKDAKIVIFLWDRTRATQEHAKFKQGIEKIDGIDGCIVINAPSIME